MSIWTNNLPDRFFFVKRVRLKIQRLYEKDGRQTHKSDLYSRFINVKSALLEIVCEIYNLKESYKSPQIKIKGRNLFRGARQDGVTPELINFYRTFVKITLILSLPVEEKYMGSHNRLYMETSKARVYLIFSVVVIFFTHLLRLGLYF